MQVLSTYGQWIMTGWGSKEEGRAYQRHNAAYLGLWRRVTQQHHDSS
jgi:hypothetical protein